MTFKGRDPGKCKIVIGNKITEEVKSFNYLGNLISYENEVNIHNKLNNCFIITGIENYVFSPQTTFKKTRMKLYSTLVLPALSYGSENWTIKARDARRITAAEIKMRETQRDTLGQMIQQIQGLQRIKYNPNLGQKLNTEKIGHDM
jgi:uncharacterized protein YebE (UPF0316 family)